MSANQGIWYFDNVNLFDIICPHKFAEHRAKHTFTNFKKGDFVYFANETAAKIYLIASGKVKITSYLEDGREIVKAVLAQGELFGELALLGEEKRSDFAQVLTDDTMLCPMTIDLMHQLMRDYKDFSFQVYKMIGKRIVKLERRLEALICKDVKTRLLEFLIDLAEECGQLAGTETLIKHNYTQKDIADLVGTSRQTVTTLLNDLKEENLIYFDRSRILIRDLKNLKSLVKAQELNHK